MTSALIQRIEGSQQSEVFDSLATEEPLEIRVGSRPVSITMRTPGSDLELAAGFLFSEGVIRSREEVAELKSCGPIAAGSAFQNVVRVTLKEGVVPNLKGAERNFYTTSSCGICGKGSLEAVQAQRALLPQATLDDAFEVSSETLLGLVPKLRAAQGLFEATGGLHATGLFDLKGNLLWVREDVGRHNAFDKVVGAAFLAGQLPLSRHIALVSGRASFELLQKAAMAGIRLVAAIGAPSSLAVALAVEQNITLIGFLRGGRFNVYHGAFRVLHRGGDHEAADPR